MKDKLLLVQGVQRSSRHCRFGLGHAPLATHQVHLHPRGWKKFIRLDFVKNQFPTSNPLPGNTLDPGLHWSPLPRMTSTSRFPLRSQRLSWISPRAGEARTCLPTNWPGPSPSMNSESWPSEFRRAADVNQLEKLKSKISIWDGTEKT